MLFVDDCLAYVLRNLPIHLLEHFNAFHPSIQFTMEFEEEKLNFLDMTTYHHSSELETSWFQKPSASGRYLNFFASLPFQWKMIVIKNLFQRAIILSDKCYRTASIKIAKNLFLGDCLPSNLFKKPCRSAATCAKGVAEIPEEKFNPGCESSLR